MHAVHTVQILFNCSPRLCSTSSADPHVSCFFARCRQCYLYGRSLQELNGYYHNVWKTRSTDVADEFLTMRELGATRAEYGAFV